MRTLARLLHRVYSRVVRAGGARIGQVVRARWYARWARPGVRSLGEWFPGPRRVRVERVPGSPDVRHVLRDPPTAPELHAESHALAAALAELRADATSQAASRLTDLARQLRDTAGARRVSLIAAGRNDGAEGFVARAVNVAATGPPPDHADAVADALVCRTRA
jgi:hypothetical protein